MLKRLLLMLMPIIVFGLLAGCTGKEEEKGKDFGLLPVTKMDVKVDEEFSISRPVDLNSGYIWREKYDESMIELLENTVETETKENGAIVLYQVFHFKAKKKGNTQIFLASTRSTLEGPIVASQEVFDIYIK